MDRQSKKKAFLAKNNLENAQIEKLAADASFRTYDRIIDADKTFILMDADPEREEISPFIAVDKFLHEKGFSVPKIIDVDHKNNFILMEDLGDALYSKVLSGAIEVDDEVSEEMFYIKAIDALLKLHKITPEDKLIPYYSDDLLKKEANLLIDWYFPTLNGENISTKLSEEYNIIWDHLIPYTRHIPETTVLRDYHADNLLWLSEREGFKKVGILDFQDAVIGSPVYDIVSLLEDARRDVDRDLAHDMISRYLENRPDIPRRDFLASYSILGAQRNCKIIGIFTRKAVRDKDSRYLRFLPRVWSYLEQDLRHPLLVPLKSWFDKVISPSVRKIVSTAL